MLGIWDLGNRTWLCQVVCLHVWLSNMAFAFSTLFFLRCTRQNVVMDGFACTASLASFASKSGLKQASVGRLCTHMGLATLKKDKIRGCGSFLGRWAGGVKDAVCLVWFHCTCL